MLGWAIEVAADLKKPNKAGTAYSLERLRNIDLQGRKLEYRGSGLKRLPQVMPDVQELELEITSARAAAETVSSKLRQLKDKSSAAERQALIDAVIPNVASMVEQLKLASVIVEQEPWINPLVLREKIKKAERDRTRYFAERGVKAKATSIAYRKLIEQLIAGKDYFKELTLKQRQDFWREIRLFGLTKWVRPNLRIMELPLYCDTLIQNIDPVDKSGSLGGTLIDYSRYTPSVKIFIDLHNENLESIDFTSELIDGVKFNAAQMQKSVFLSTLLYRSSLFQARLQGASFKGGTLISNCNFGSAILSNSFFDNTTICQSNFDYVRVGSSTFNQCRIYHVSFVGLQAVRSIFNELRLFHFDQVDFSGADFSNATFNKCQFGDSKFVKANFTGAAITDSSFSVPKGQLDRFDFGCDLNKAIFKKAILQNVDLLRAVNLDKADLRGAKYDYNTKWPVGFDPAKAGVILI